MICDFEIRLGERNKMRLFKTLLLTIVASMMFVGSASALVTFGQTTTAVGPLDINDTFQVDILLTWDGVADGTGTPGGLIGIFASHQWSNTQLTLLGANINLGPNMFESRPVPLKGTAYAPLLGRLGTIAGGVSGDDLSSTARTIQYSQSSLIPLQASNAKTNELITTLTFQVIGAGDGFAEIDPTFLIGDDVTGDSFAFAPGIVLEINAIPEPGTALLMGLGLAGLAAAGRRND